MSKSLILCEEESDPTRQQIHRSSGHEERVLSLENALLIGGETRCSLLVRHTRRPAGCHISVFGKSPF